jgi:hypothetical protein|tara:strand:- start:511 stop:741 length:231 start_codon:yes stop_codon:yes gene_type:complete
MKKSSKRISDLEKDISYCIDVLGLNNEQIGMVFRCAEELGNFSVQYFMEEFIFDMEPEQLMNYADPEYLKIDWRLN